MYYFTNLWEQFNHAVPSVVIAALILVLAFTSAAIVKFLVQKLMQVIKIDVAFKLYLKHEYFASAVLLAGLIDSTSINQSLKTNPSPTNVSQCWKCYGNVIQDNFGGTYFSSNFPANISAKDDKRANATIDFFKSINHDSCPKKSFR